MLLRFFAVHRAMVRAKVAMLTRDTQSIERYRGLAMTLTAPEPPTLAITCGLSGSGKTWFSERAMIRQPAIRIRSDVERKRMLRVNFRILHCVASQAELRSRIEARSRASTDASEADATVMERQRDWWEAFGAQESAHVVEVRTAEPEALERALVRLHMDATVRSST